MTEQANSVPVNDSLNHPKSKLGIHWHALMACVGAAVAIGLICNILLGVILLFALPALVRIVTLKDQKMLHLVFHSFTQSSYYDPSKRRRAC